MPTYKITDSGSGRSLNVTGDSPPTEQEAEELFKSTAPEPDAGGFGALREAEQNIPGPTAGFGQLRQAESNIPVQEESKPRVPVYTSFPVEPLSTDKQTLDRQIEQARTEAATGARILPVVAAGLATGGAGALPAAAAMGFTTGAGELAGEGIEVASGQREKIEPRRVGGAVLRGSIPIIGRGGALARGALNYGAQFGSNIAAKYLEEGRAPTLGEVSVEGLTALPSALAGVASGVTSPKGEKQLQEAARAAEEIQARTGRELPRLVGETTQDLGTLRGELRRIAADDVYPATPKEDAMMDGRRAVLLAAANVNKEAQVDAATIANDAKNALERHIGPLNADVETSIDDLSKAYTEGKLGTQEDIQRELQSMLPGPSGESRYSLASKVKTDAKDLLKGFESQSEADFSKLRNNPVHEDTSIAPVTNVKKLAEEFVPITIAKERVTENPNSIVDQYGKPIGEPEVSRSPIPSALPEGTQQYFRQIQEMAPTQSVSQLRAWRTKILESIDDDSVLPGAGNRMKYRLIGAITDDIIGGLSRVEEGLPVGQMRSLLRDFQTANKNYKTRVDDIENVFSSGVLKDVGKRGAMTPEALASKITGPNAISTIESLKRLYGPNAGPIVEKVHGLIRDEVVNQFTDRVSKTTDIGGLFNHITNDKTFPSELLDQVFPNANQIQELAKRQLKANGLPSTDAAVRGLLEGDKSIADAMTSPNKAATLAAADSALAAKAKQEAALKSTLIRDIAAKNGEALVKNPEVLVKGFVSGKYTPKDVSDAMSVIRAHSPQAASNIEFSLVEALIRNASTGEGHVDMARIASELSSPSSTSTGGPMLRVVEAAIGPERTKNLREVAELAVKAEKPREKVAATMNLSPMTVRGIGASALHGALSGMAFGNSVKNATVGAVLGAGGGTGARGVQKWSDAIKYSVAARLMADPRLSRLADKAYDSQRLANAVRLAAHSIELESDDEKLRDEARKLAEQLK